jgi:hypothetical protein
MSSSCSDPFFSQLDWLMPSLARAESLRRSGNPEEAQREALHVIRENLVKSMPALPRLDLCGNLREQADRLLDRRLVLLNEEIRLERPVNWSRLAETDGQRNWHLGYMYWLNALAESYQKTRDERYAAQWRTYVEEFLDHCPYAADARGYWPTRPMVHNDLQTCNLGENGGPEHAQANPESRSQWMSLSCHFRIEAWLSNLARLADSKHLDDAFLARVLYSLVNDHSYVCVMNPRENTPNQFTAVTLSVLKLALLIPEYRGNASLFLVAWERLQRVFTNNLLPDGSDLEQSPDYNCFLLDLCVELLQLLQGAPASRRESVLDPARKRLRFLTAILSPDGTLPPIAKAHAEDKRAHFLKLAEVLDEPSALAALRENAGPLRDSIAFPHGGYYCLRDAESHLLFKASSIGSGHMHEDCLSFLLWSGGKELLTDPSHYTYNDSPGEEAALNAYALGTQGHNAVTIDGHGQNRMAARRSWPRRDNEVPWLRACEQDTLPFRACQDNHHGVVEGLYGGGFGEANAITVIHRRTIIRVNKTGWLVLDAFSGDTRGRIASQHWHLSRSFARKEVSLVSSRELVTTRGSGSNLRILRLDPVEPVPNLLHGSTDPVGGWVFPKYGQKVPSFELVWQSHLDTQPVIATWIEATTAPSKVPIQADFPAGNVIEWTSGSEMSLQLKLASEGFLLKAGTSPELRWQFDHKNVPDLPALPTVIDHNSQ